MVLEAPRGDALKRRAYWLEYATIVWNAAEAVVAVTAGWIAGSIALIGFGLDSMIEVFAASVVVWELKGVGEDRQRRALRLIGASFFALALYVTVEAARDLVVGAEAAESPVGIGLAIVSLLIMPALAFGKSQTGRQLRNAALIADSRETWLCSYLSAILLGGLLLNATMGWWWADPLAAIGIAYLALREGMEAWRGEDYGHS